MNIDSLRELAVLDGERLQALWDEIDRLRAPQAPIAKIVVDDTDGLMTMLYAPGLPPGEHDVYLDPHEPGLRGNLITLQPDDAENWECPKCHALTSTMLTRCYTCDTPRPARNSSGN